MAQPQLFDPNQLLEQIKAQQQEVLNAGMVPPPQPTAPLTTGTPVIDQSTLQALIARALQPDPNQQQNDLTSARMKMFSAMAQPRRQGQSVAGNITGAMQQGVDSIDASRAKQQALAIQQAQIGSAVASQDQQRRNQEMQMQVVAAKYPMEMAMAGEQYKQMMQTGKVAEAQTFQKLFLANPETVLQQFKTEQAGKQAKIDLEKAQTGKETALGVEATSKADFYDRGGASKEGTTQLNDGSGRMIQHKSDGSLNMIVPGDTKYTPEMAKKELEKEQKAKDDVWFRPGRMGLPDITPEMIAAKVTERQKNQVIPLQPATSVGVKPGQTVPTATTADFPGGAAALAKPSPYDAMFAAAAKQYGVDPQDLKALAITESSLNPKAVNTKDGGGGSFGLMQVNGQHLPRLGITQEQLMDPQANINAGAEIWKQALNKVGGDKQKAVQIYKGATSAAGQASVAPATKFVATATPPAPLTTSTGEPIQVLSRPKVVSETPTNGITADELSIPQSAWAAKNAPRVAARQVEEAVTAKKKLELEIAQAKSEIESFPLTGKFDALRKARLTRLERIYSQLQ